MTATAGSRTDVWLSTGPASGWRLLFLLGPAFIVSPGLLQKAYGARDERAVRRGIAANGIALLIFACAPAAIGLAARTVSPSIERPDLALPTILAAALPPAVGIVALAAVFSAEISSADAVLFMLATSASRDLYRGLLRPAASEDDVLRVARIAAVVGGISGIGVAMVYGSVRAAVSVFYAILTVTLFVPVVAGVYVHAAGPARRHGLDCRRCFGACHHTPLNRRRWLWCALPCAGGRGGECGGVPGSARGSYAPFLTSLTWYSV
jgi:SSS family solute:Na+ symporter